MEIFLKKREKRKEKNIQLKFNYTDYNSKNIVAIIHVYINQQCPLKLNIYVQVFCILRR